MSARPAPATAKSIGISQRLLASESRSRAGRIAYPSGPPLLRSLLLRRLLGEHVDLLDGRLLEQLARLVSQRLPDGAVEVRLAPVVVGKRVEDAERRWAEPNCEPAIGIRLLFDQRQALVEKAGDLLLFSRQRLEAHEKPNGHRGCHDVSFFVVSGAAQTS